MGSKYQTQDMVARGLRNARPECYRLDRANYPMADEATWDFLTTTHAGNVARWNTTVNELRIELRDRYPSFNEMRFLTLAGERELFEEACRIYAECDKPKDGKNPT